MSTRRPQCAAKREAGPTTEVAAETVTAEAGQVVSATDVRPVAAAGVGRPLKGRGLAGRARLPLVIFREPRVE